MGNLILLGALIFLLFLSLGLCLIHTLNAQRRGNVLGCICALLSGILVAVLINLVYTVSDKL